MMIARMLKVSAATRNSGPILEVLQQVLPQFLPRDRTISCLEVASGTGQHAAYFCPQLPHVHWYPTEVDETYMMSIQAWKNDGSVANFYDPHYLDITQTAGDPEADLYIRNLEPETFHFMFNCNMMHISPWACSEGLFRNAGILLKPGGLLITYGPFAFNGSLTPESNVKFDQGLKAQNPEWGVRDVELQLKPLAEKHGICLELVFDMPANNKTLVWRKRGQA